MVEGSQDTAGRPNQAGSRTADAARTVQAYIEALESHRPSPGKPVPSAVTMLRIEEIDTSLPEVGPLHRLALIQERLDLTDELAASSTRLDLPELQAAFVATAADYSLVHGISFEAWRAAGIPSSVLHQAGIGR